ncbi:hypothetical protein [Streptomyces sp. SID3343]|uniref:hypothetical protein n=1 Tax=Streptomyces sp. SID3343 TaxID=2690260 RepID=UPI001927A11D|nr:hypothetical protein [Streptomyces sp. SID3343]
MTPLPLHPSVLTDPAYVVPAVPDAPLGGVAWLRASVVRFSRDEAHRRRRRLAVAELARIDPADLRRQAASGAGGPVEILARALGLPSDSDCDADTDARTDTPTVTDIAADVATVARCYQPHMPVTDAADRAVDRLVRACGGIPDEATANRIGLLVQACDATKALAANLLSGRTDPPVPRTRRVGPDGILVEVDLAETFFGLGPHACPGRPHAIALAAGQAAATTRKAGAGVGAERLCPYEASDTTTAAAVVVRDGDTDVPGGSPVSPPAT